MVDYFKVLNISEEASQKDVKIAFRKMAIKYHPDKNKIRDSKDKFIEIKIAYDILSNPISRAIYEKDFSVFKKLNAIKNSNDEFSKKIFQRSNSNNQENQLSIRITKIFKVIGLSILLAVLIKIIIDSNINRQIESSEIQNELIDSTHIKEYDYKNETQFNTETGELKF